MASIKVFLKNGQTKEFPHRGRPGGSYTKSVRYEGGFVIVQDEWYDETAFPACDVERVEKEADRGW